MDAFRTFNISKPQKPSAGLSPVLPHLHCPQKSRAEHTTPGAASVEGVDHPPVPAGTTPDALQDATNPLQCKGTLLAYVQFRELTKNQSY